MRSFLISFLLFTIMICSIIVTVDYMEETLTSFCDSIATIEHLVHQENWEEALFVLDQLQVRWSEQGPFWHLLLDQRDIVEIDATIRRVAAFFECRDPAQGLAELRSLLTAYEHLIRIEKITLENIF